MADKDPKLNYNNLLMTKKSPISCSSNNNNTTMKTTSRVEKSIRMSTIRTSIMRTMIKVSSHKYRLRVPIEE